MRTKSGEAVHVLCVCVGGGGGLEAVRGGVSTFAQKVLKHILVMNFFKIR